MIWSRFTIFVFLLLVSEQCLRLDEILPGLASLSLELKLPSFGNYYGQAFTIPFFVLIDRRKQIWNACIYIQGMKVVYQYPHSLWTMSFVPADLTSVLQRWGQMREGMNSGSSTWHPKSIHFSNILRTKRNCPILPQPVNVNSKNPDPKLSQLILTSALCSTQFFIRISDGNLKP